MSRATAGQRRSRTPYVAGPRSRTRSPTATNGAALRTSAPSRPANRRGVVPVADSAMTSAASRRNVDQRVPQLAGRRAEALADLEHDQERQQSARRQAREHHGAPGQEHQHQGDDEHVRLALLREQRERAGRSGERRQPGHGASPLRGGRGDRGRQSRQDERQRQQLAVDDTAAEQRRRGEDRGCPRGQPRPDPGGRRGQPADEPREQDGGDDGERSPARAAPTGRRCRRRARTSRSAPVAGRPSSRRTATTRAPTGRRRSGSHPRPG